MGMILLSLDTLQDLNVQQYTPESHAHRLSDTVSGSTLVNIFCMSVSFSIYMDTLYQILDTKTGNGHFLLT